jgi:hypothetical protein
MKRVIVRYIDDKGNLSAVATDAMPDDEAGAVRDRVEAEHSAAGAQNRWIRVGDHSVQSRQIQTISLEEPLTGPTYGEDYYYEPLFRRDMEF